MPTGKEKLTIKNKSKPTSKPTSKQSTKPTTKESTKESPKCSYNKYNNNYIYLDNVNTSFMNPKVEKMYKQLMQKKIFTQSDRDNIINSGKTYILKLCESLDKYSIYYTSGENESNNIIINCAVNAYKKIRKIKPHVVISSVEHESILKHTRSLLDSDQIELTIIKPNSYGCILSEHINNAVKSNTCLVSITYINKELGSVNNIEKISTILHEKKIPLHSDCTYLFGKHKLDLTKTNIDAATISFDKINGPNGVGALIINNDFYNGYKLYEHSIVFEDKYNNIPCIASAVEAFKISSSGRKLKNEKILKMRNEIINKLSAICQTMTFANFMKSDAPPLDDSAKLKNKLVILGPPANNESYYTPSILSIILISDKNKTGIDIKAELESKEIIIGVPDIEQNIMYKDMGMPQESVKYIIRISLHDDIVQTDIDKLVETLKKII